MNKEEIKNIIINAYNSLKTNAEKMVKNQEKEISLSNKKITDLFSILKENNIPKNSIFSIGYSCDYTYPCIKYYITTHFSKEDIDKYIEENFKKEIAIAFEKIGLVIDYTNIFQTKIDTDLFINLFLNLYQEYKKGNIDYIVNYYYFILKIE